MASVKDFYEGLYYSPIYANHHRITCNVGFHPITPLPTSATIENEEMDEKEATKKCNATLNQDVHELLRSSTRRFHKEHTPNDLYQLQLYQELFTMVPLHSLLGISTVAPCINDRALTIVDIGSGPGGGICALHALFPYARLVGVDISSQAIVRSKENWLGFTRYLLASNELYHKPIKPIWINQSCELMSDIHTASCDIVCAVQTLSEVQDLSKAIHEINRILRPGGILLIADFIPPSERDHLCRVLLDDAKKSLSSPWTLAHEKVVSFQTALACKVNSSQSQILIQEYIPPAFQADIETLFFVQGSPLYEQLQLGHMGYRMVCLTKKRIPAHDNGSESAFENDSDEGSEQAWSVEADDGEEEDIEQEHDEVEIDDHDLPNYYNYKELFPELEVLKTNYPIIRQEMEAVLATRSWPFWPEKHYSEQSKPQDWRVFPFCYTFPAYDATKTTWVPSTCEMCPKTVEILRQIPGIRTALFSKLGPQTTLGAHRGWADLSNHILRCHLGIVVPTLTKGESCCSMNVGGEVMAHQEKEILVFDDSKLHYAYNHHPLATRMVLIVDLYRPDHLPRGRAVGGHTDELDEFIETFGRRAFDSGYNDQDNEEEDEADDEEETL